MAPGEGEELAAPLRGPLERDDLAEPLDGVHRVGVEVGERFAGARAEHVHPAPGEEGAQGHHREDGGEDRGERPAEPEQDRDDRRGNEHRHQAGGNGVGEEVLHQLHVVGRHRHEVARAPAEQPRGREGVDLAVEVDPHPGEHPERHVVRDPRLHPVQDPGRRGGREQGVQPRGEVPAALEGGHRERAQHPDPDEAGHPDDPEPEGEGEPPAPRADVAEELAERPVPPETLRAGDLVVRAARREQGGQILGGRPARGRGELDVPRPPALLRLAPHQAEVDPLAAHQLRVPAGLRDPPAVEDEDPVRPDDARQAVGEDEGGAARHQAFERLLDDRLVLRIHRAQRLVEHQDGGVAEDRAGDRDPLALPAGEPHPAFADHRPVAVRQPLDELVGVRGPRRRGELLAGRVGPAEAKVVLDRAVEEDRVLVDDRDPPVDVVGGEAAEVAPADAHRARVRIVEAKQQADDRGLAGPARPDEPDPLPGLDPEVEAPMGGAAGAGIGEPDPLELHRRGELRRRRRRRRPRRPRRLLARRGAFRGGILHDRAPREEVQHPVGRRRADQPLMEEGAQVALRPEHLDAHHQHDEQLGEGHRPRVHPEGPVGEHRRRPDREPHVGDPPAEGVDREHPHRGAEDFFRADGETPAARAALPERLEGREALEGVEELGRERRVGALAPLAALAVPPGEGGRSDEGEEGEREEERRHRKVEEREEREYGDRGEGGHAELGQELAEPRLELLDPLHERHQHLPGALEPEPRRPELRHLVVQARTQMHLHPGRGPVRDHVAPVLEPAPEQHDRADEGELPGQRPEGFAREDPGDQPSEGGEPPDPDQGGGEPDRDRERDPAPHPRGEREEASIRQHRAGYRPAGPGGAVAAASRRSTRRSASPSTIRASRALLPMNPASIPRSRRATRGSK